MKYLKQIWEVLWFFCSSCKKCVVEVLVDEVSKKQDQSWSFFAHLSQSITAAQKLSTELQWSHGAEDLLPTVLQPGRQWAAGRPLDQRSWLGCSAGRHPLPIHPRTGQTVHPTGQYSDMTGLVCSSGSGWVFNFPTVCTFCSIQKLQRFS